MGYITIANQNLVLRETRANRYISRLDSEQKKNILTHIDLFMYNDHHFMVFEMFQMELASYINTPQNPPLSWKAIKTIMIQIFEGLIALKSLNLIHRDTKPSNILIDPQSLNVKICDFGLCCLKDSKNEGTIGTTPYSAPEVSRGDEVGFPADMWSTGCAFYILVTKKVLFYSAEKKDIADNVSEYLKEVTEEEKGNTPFLDIMKNKLKRVDGAYEFLRLILKEDPMKRLTPKEALEELEKLNNRPLFI
eukprot:GHVP01053114.1.p1 GENE.GHVP01053114.1~~GHVP01053114.1.p1  ORF type:complete len:249 (-),score=34.57 GHVP01053114.1:276-1022(-)